MISSDEDFHPKIRDEFPYKVEKFTQVTIVLQDNVKLAATLWIPRSEKKDEKFGTILEYLPYRKADWTSNRDEMRLKYLSGFGYVSCRVDRRGSGNSEGLFDDEYSLEEQSDGLEILQWIEKQNWSNGKIVIYGKSWGGFNGLQLAFHQPKSLCGVISAYSTDDRYSDDIHYIGGCLTAQEALYWSSQMLLWLSLPPHRDYHGGIDEGSDLIEIWKDRLNAMIPLDTFWVKHQNRDSYWRYGSICEDYSRIKCPVFLIGGFADLYTDPVFRLMNRLKCPKRALIGPWGHQWPDSAYPGPQMGYLEELVQWLDYHIKGIENNYEKKEMISIYQLYPNEAELHSNVRERKGRWIHTNQMPTFPLIHIQRNSNDFIKEEEEQNNENEMKYNLSYKCLDDELIVKKKNCPSKISFLSSEETGLASGNLLGWGNENDGGNAIDQREDDGRSITFHSLPLKQDLELFGFPRIVLNVGTNSGYGLICARLCRIDEQSGSSILLSRGFLNLTHNKSHENPEVLTIDEMSKIEIVLSSLCVKIDKGSCLCLSLSSSYWPIVWPSIKQSTLTLICFNEKDQCCLFLPLLQPNYSTRNDFSSPEVAKGIEMKILRNPSVDRSRIFDENNENVVLRIRTDDGAMKYPDGLIFDETNESVYQIRRNDPQSAKISIRRSLKYSYENAEGYDVQIETNSTMFSQSNPSRFEIVHHLNVRNVGKTLFDRKWNLSFEREY